MGGRITILHFPGITARLAHRGHSSTPEEGSSYLFFSPSTEMPGCPECSSYLNEHVRVMKIEPDGGIYPWINAILVRIIIKLPLITIPYFDGSHQEIEMGNIDAWGWLYADMLNIVWASPHDAVDHLAEHLYVSRHLCSFPYVGK
jgi:hypothetical protein